MASNIPPGTGWLGMELEQAPRWRGYVCHLCNPIVEAARLMDIKDILEHGKYWHKINGMNIVAYRDKVIWVDRSANPVPRPVHPTPGILGRDMEGRTNPRPVVNSTTGFDFSFGFARSGVVAQNPAPKAQGSTNEEIIRPFVYKPPNDDKKSSESETIGPFVYKPVDEKQTSSEFESIGPFVYKPSPETRDSKGKGKEGPQLVSKPTRSAVSGATTAKTTKKGQKPRKSKYDCSPLPEFIHSQTFNPQNIYSDGKMQLVPNNPHQAISQTSLQRARDVEGQKLATSSRIHRDHTQSRASPELRGMHAEGTYRQLSDFLVEGPNERDTGYLQADPLPAPVPGTLVRCAQHNRCRWKGRALCMGNNGDVHLNEFAHGNESDNALGQDNTPQASQMGQGLSSRVEIQRQTYKAPGYDSLASTNECTYGNDLRYSNAYQAPQMGGGVNRMKESQGTSNEVDHNDQDMHNQGLRQQGPPLPYDADHPWEPTNFDLLIDPELLALSNEVLGNMSAQEIEDLIESVKTPRNKH